MTEPYYQDGPVTIFHGDCIEVMRDLLDASVDAVVTDPPYGLEFMGKSWDSFKVGRSAAYSAGGSLNIDGIAAQSGKGGAGPVYVSRPARRCGKCGKQAWSGSPCVCPDPDWEIDNSPLLAFQSWCEAWAREALRVLKPGGHLLAFGGSRTWHRLAAGIEDAGFEIRDSIAWLYGSGFAKSWNFATQYNGEWCGCAGENPVPYSHASDPDVRGVRVGVLAPAVARGTGDDADLFTPVQRSASRGGVEEARAQGARGVVGGVRGGVRGQDAGSDESGVEGRLVHRAGQGLPDGENAGPSEGASERVRRRASAGDGGDTGPSSDAARGSSPHQSGPSGQPTGEPQALPGSHGSLDDGALRGCAVCTRCGGLRPEYRGFGTGLKPAVEPIVVARKPLVGTVAANILAHGTGALNIDATRTGVGDGRKMTRRTALGVMNDDGWTPKTQTYEMSAGRWPTNVVLAHSPLLDDDGEVIGDACADGCMPGCAVAELDRQSGVQRDGVAVKRNRDGAPQGKSPWSLPGAAQADAGYGGEGGASRFFPTFRYEAKAGSAERPRQGGVQHPTVKPLALMQWLVRLVTRPGGVVLEPFAGSGTTVEACLREGFDVVAIEREAEYLPLIEQRIRKDHPQELDFGGAA